MSISSELSTSTLFILLIDLINGAQFLKTASLVFLEAEIFVSFAPSSTTVILLSTSAYASF